MQKNQAAVLKEADMAKFPEENPNCIMRIDSDLQIIYKNKAVDDLLNECGFKKSQIRKILPKNIKQEIKNIVKANTIKCDLEVDLDHKIYCYSIAPVRGKRCVNIYGMDITKRKQSEHMLKMSQEVLKKQKHDLEKKNVALAEIVSLAHREKQLLRQNIIRNVLDAIMPIIQKLKRINEHSQDVALLEKTLKHVLGLEGITQKSMFTSLRLSPREREISNFIKHGMSSKEIAGLVNISEKTVEKHRRNIRNKFKIQHKKINLCSFLQAETTGHGLGI